MKTTSTTTDNEIRSEISKIRSCLGRLPDNDPSVPELQSKLKKLKENLPARSSDYHWMYAAE